MRPSFTDALVTRRAFWSGGGLRPVEFRLQALRRLRQMLRLLN